MKSIAVWISLLGIFSAVPAHAGESTSIAYAAAQEFQYKVARRDNLTLIAKRFGVPISELISEKHNPQLAARVMKRGNADLIFAGEIIVIPALYHTTGTIEKKTGQSLYVIASSNIGALTKPATIAAAPTAKSQVKAGDAGLFSVSGRTVPFWLIAATACAVLIMTGCFCYIVYQWRALKRERGGVYGFLSADQFLKSARMMVVGDLAAALECKEGVMKDGTGNPILLKRFSESVAKGTLKGLEKMRVYAAETALREPSLPKVRPAA